MTAILKVNKDQNKTLRWIQKACSTDSMREILHGAHFTNRATVACDGYRLHATPKATFGLNGEHTDETLDFGKFAAATENIVGEQIEG